MLLVTVAYAGFLGNQGQHNHPVDEQAIQDAHTQAYQQGSGGNLPASAMGGAAALQVRLAKVGLGIIKAMGTSFRA